ncbi:hypothetical protein SAMN05421770_101318 [Granulicella rosea]|uniref:DUF2251 domain-containing protein n=1 Tax=Granulicella rosea TaxID=474952 RepID=A0A239D7H6_9BACT|nr:DUF2251 domain-containing protein [Granulicella rosea]SNS27968.1 hypothetical protein SAMN05421770_101318 [Granulicella rosea]
MESLSFRPGRAFLSSNSPIVPWTVVFEDEGVAAYFYACDRSQTTQEEAIQDAMLIYNVGSMQDVEAERIASVAWSRDGLQAVLYLDGTAQALFDFAQKCGYCRLNFPNFLGDVNGWRQSDHGWNEAAWQRFEAALLS